MTDTTCKIANDLIYDCDKPAIRGAKDRLIVLPKRLIKGYTEDATNPLILEAINRKLNALETEYEGKAQEYVGEGKILSPSTSFLRDDFGTRYMHSLQFRVHGTTPTVKLEMVRLAREPEGVIIILQQNYKEDGSKWLVMGRDCGLYITEQTDEEGRNIYTITLANQDGFEEPLPPSNLYDTSEDVSDAIVADLLSTTLPSA